MNVREGAREYRSSPRTRHTQRRLGRTRRCPELDHPVLGDRLDSVGSLRFRRSPQSVRDRATGYVGLLTAASRPLGIHAWDVFLRQRHFHGFDGHITGFRDIRLLFRDSLVQRFAMALLKRCRTRPVHAGPSLRRFDTAFQGIHPEPILVQVFARAQRGGVSLDRVGCSRVLRWSTWIFTFSSRHALHPRFFAALSAVFRHAPAQIHGDGADALDSRNIGEQHVPFRPDVPAVIVGALRDAIDVRHHRAVAMIEIFEAVRARGAHSVTLYKPTGIVTNPNVIAPAQIALAITAAFLGSRH